MVRRIKELVLVNGRGYIVGQNGCQYIEKYPGRDGYRVSLTASRDVLVPWHAVLTVLEEYE